MKKVIRLTENDLVRLVKRVIKETSELSFSTWLENQKGHDLKTAYCVAVKDCLNDNNYKNYDDAPEEFKQLVRISHCFYHGGGGILRNKVLAAKRTIREKVVREKRTTSPSETATITLLDYLSNNRF